LAVLERFAAPVWSEVELRTDRGQFTGVIIPRSETSDDEHIVLRLQGGYHVGIAADSVTGVTVHGRREPQPRTASRAIVADAQRASVAILATGGTIAGRHDYRTGAVSPSFTPEDLYALVPELAGICSLRAEQLFSVLSENMGPEEWIRIATRVAELIREGVDGIVITHGTDTMQHTASALTFMVQNPPVPIVMVGSQRSSDRPSSDAAINLINAVRAAATGDIAEVTVCMFGPTSDQYGLLHSGTRVRKMHSSYRSTFRTIGDVPLAMLDGRGVTSFVSQYNRRRGDRDVRLLASHDSRVTLVYAYPGLDNDVIDALVEKGYHGIVFAGTGLGHVGRRCFPAIARAAKAGVHLYMTVQTLWGYCGMYGYETGRDLMRMGVVPCANMLPEVALVKLGWAMAQASDPADVQRLMLTPIGREITEREPYNGYLVFQGEIPEVQAFLRSIER
jgi:glutamyl-tRNA(Gln) amidotransferase subunit D